LPLEGRSSRTIAGDDQSSRGPATDDRGERGQRQVETLDPIGPAEAEQPWRIER
jgi:hypothetical protein